MDFDIITIFPEFFTGPLSHGMVFQAQKRGLIDIRIHDLRDFTTDRHKTVDDRPFGGGRRDGPKAGTLVSRHPKNSSGENVVVQQGHSTHTPGQTV
jgi:tRNA (guanine-N1)-methyltransferase